MGAAALSGPGRECEKPPGKRDGFRLAGKGFLEILHQGGDAFGEGLLDFTREILLREIVGAKSGAIHFQVLHLGGGDELALDVVNLKPDGVAELRTELAVALKLVDANDQNARGDGGAGFSGGEGRVEVLDRRIRHALGAVAGVFQPERDVVGENVGQRRASLGVDEIWNRDHDVAEEPDVIGLERAGFVAIAVVHADDCDDGLAGLAFQRRGDVVVVMVNPAPGECHDQEHEG